MLGEQTGERVAWWRRSRARDRVHLADPRAGALDAFDQRLQRSLIVSFAAGSLIHLLVTHLGPGGGGDTHFADALVVLGFVSALGLARLPWARYGRDLFAVLLLYAAVLTAGLIYSTGGAASPFGATYLLIAISAGLYNRTPIAALVAVACAALGFLPLAYSAPGPGFLTQQLVQTVGFAAIAWFQWLMLPELFRRARSEPILQADLQESRRLRNELEAANARLARQALTDPLTDLPNHGAIIGVADLAVAEAAAAGGALSFLFFDIDRFKRINDTHGHPIGDIVLAEVARRAGAALAGAGRLGRYGGEEFLAILPGARGAEAFARAESLRAAIAAQPFLLPDGAALHATISVGVATAAPHSVGRETLLRAADAALYRAKAAGRDCVSR